MAVFSIRNRRNKRTCTGDCILRTMFRIDFNRRKLVGFLILLPFLWFTTEIPALAENALLKDIVVTNTRDDLLLYFSVDNCFTDQMIRAIQNGIPTSFKFFIRLIEIRNYALDKKIADLEFSHTVRYDNLKNEYFVARSEEKDKGVFFRDFDEVKKTMSEVVGLKVASLGKLKRDMRYKMKMMAQLDKIELPFNLHYVLFFLSLWDFETDWYTVEFRY